MSAFSLANVALASRLLLGTARYPSLQCLADAVKASGAEVVTVGLRRLAPELGGGNTFWQRMQSLGCRVLPNTAGCHTAQEAITLAQMAREIFGTTWIKLEVTGDEHTLQPDPFELVDAATQLVRDGFTVLPYCTDDLVTCRRLLDAGCPVLMPWAAPIGSGQGLINPQALRTLRERLPDATLIIDAGIGAPSHAALAMEMGFDAVLLNSAVSQSGEPVLMARAFRQAIEAGRAARLAGVMSKQDFAVPSTPVTGQPFVLGG
jgi:thiazole synthase